MAYIASDNYLTQRDWHRAAVSGKELILRHTSALEFLQLFNGYLNEKTIDVYAKRFGEYENINYHIVDSFDEIDFVRIDDVLCTSISQTINDMLDNYNNIDEQSLIEGLSQYYYMHGKSFDGIAIRSDNTEHFNAIKDWAIEYYDEA
jgi:hypothetical protein